VLREPHFIASRLAPVNCRPLAAEATFMPQEPRELSREDFEATFLLPMVDISNSAAELVDLWRYADQVIANAYHNCTAWDWRVAHIYESGDARYQHVGIPVPKDDTYLTVVVDVDAREILGHSILDLGALYSGSKNGET
jgi:hypothetical protein